MHGFVLMKRCWGLTRSLNRCGRIGEWKFFCHEHRKQPVVWLFVFIFTIVGGTASILGYLSTISGNRDQKSADHKQEKTVVDTERGKAEAANDSRVKIVIADFDGGDENTYRFTDTILSDITDATRNDKDVTLARLGRPIREGGGADSPEQVAREVKVPPY